MSPIPIPAPQAVETQEVPGSDRLVVLLHALADGKRLRILDSLRGGEACVCELQDALGLAQSLLSHHLRVLREAGLVEDRRDGRWIYYSLVREALLEAESGLAALGVVTAVPAKSRSRCD